MKIVPVFLLIISLMACNTGVGTSQKANSKGDSADYESLLSKYREITIDTLRVYSPESLTGEFQGVELDSMDASLFPEEISKQHYLEPPGLFAIGKFKVDENRIGLITRTPSEYVPSSIKLFLFNTTQNKIESYFELADVWGDAGDYVRKDSWILKEKNNQLKIFTWVLETHQNDVDNEKDTTVQENNYYYLMNLSGKAIDTVSKDPGYLKREYGSLIKQ